MGSNYIHKSQMMWYSTVLTKLQHIIRSHHQYSITSTVITIKFSEVYAQVDNYCQCFSKADTSYTKVKWMLLNQNESSHSLFHFIFTVLEQLSDCSTSTCPISVNLTSSLRKHCEIHWVQHKSGPACFLCNTACYRWVAFQEQFTIWILLLRSLPCKIKLTTHGFQTVL